MIVICICIMAHAWASFHMFIGHSYSSCFFPLSTFFFNFRLHWVFAPVPGLSLVAVSRGHSHSARASHCGDSCSGEQALSAWASAAAAHRLPWSWLTGFAALSHMESSHGRDRTCTGRWIPIQCTTRKCLNTVLKIHHCQYL